MVFFTRNTESRELGALPVRLPTGAPDPTLVVAEEAVTPQAVAEQAVAEQTVAEQSPLEVSALFREHFDFVWRTLRAFGVPLNGVDDAVQDVFMTVHRRLPEFSGRSSPKTWIYSIAHLTAHNHRRKSQRQHHEPLQPDLATVAPEPSEHIAHAQATDFVKDFVAHLPDEKRGVFVLCVLEELSAPDAAQILGIKLNTVYSRLRLVRAEFRAALQRFALREKVS